jgi:hypothetical protein
MYTLDLDYMQWDLRWLSREARKAVVLGSELEMENKSEAEIDKETSELLMRALLVAVHRFDTGYEIGALDTPEILYKQLWYQIYERLCAIYETEYDAKDIEEEVKELIDQELEHVYDYLVAERNRRLDGLVTNYMDDYWRIARGHAEQHDEGNTSIEYYDGAKSMIMDAIEETIHALGALGGQDLVLDRTATAMLAMRMLYSFCHNMAGDGAVELFTAKLEEIKERLLNQYQEAVYDRLH